MELPSSELELKCLRDLVPESELEWNCLYRNWNLIVKTEVTPDQVCTMTLLYWVKAHPTPMTLYLSGIAHDHRYRRISPNVAMAKVH